MLVRTLKIRLTMHDARTRDVWLRILALLAIVVLSCGVKNYLTYLIRGTDLCPYLCPSVMRTDLFFSFPLLEEMFAAQRWIEEQLQRLPGLLRLTDRYRLAASLIFAPLVEETIYRGPMYLTRRTRHRTLWWTTGVLLAVLFALSHGRSGLALLPLIVLGTGSLWLIAATGRFWPGLALHVLHNFFFTSVLVYQSMWVSD